MPSTSQSQNQQQTQSLTSKIKSSILILSTTTITPYLLSIFSFPITKKHIIFLSLISTLSIIYIFTSNSKPTDPLQQVFEANKIHINNQYPTLLKGGKNKND